MKGNNFQITLSNSRRNGKKFEVSSSVIAAAITLVATSVTIWLTSFLNRKHEVSKIKFEKISAFNNELIPYLCQRNYYSSLVFVDLRRNDTTSYRRDSAKFVEIKDFINSHLYYYDVFLETYFGAYCDTELFSKNIYNKMLDQEAIIMQAKKVYPSDSTNALFFARYYTINDGIAELSHHVFERMYSTIE